MTSVRSKVEVKELSIRRETLRDLSNSNLEHATGSAALVSGSSRCGCSTRTGGGSSC